MSPPISPRCAARLRWLRCAARACPIRPRRSATRKSLAVTAADFTEALTQVTPTALREVFVELPRQSWADVGGLSGLREMLTRAVICPLRDPHLLARFGVRPVRGVLLAGPPGTGKTLVARALAAEAGVGFISVRGPELLSHWQGASERALRELFARARSVAPCIVFFDEIDSLAGARGSGDGATIERMVASLLTEMDGIGDREGAVVLGATNRLDRIDPALLRPGRFDLASECRSRIWLRRRRSSPSISAACRRQRMSTSPGLRRRRRGSPVHTSPVSAAMLPCA